MDRGYGVKIGNENQNLFGRMNRIDRICKPGSPAGEASPPVTQRSIKDKVGRKSEIVSTRRGDHAKHVQWSFS